MIHWMLASMAVLLTGCSVSSDYSLVGETTASSDAYSDEEATVCI